MKSILTFILATFLLFPLQAQEKVYTVDNLPKVHLQNKMQYVCNRKHPIKYTIKNGYISFPGK